MEEFDEELSLATKLKRLRAARDYWLNVPKDMVEMDQYGYPWLRETGLMQPKFNGCGAAGCLAGWLQTMPEFREWAMMNDPEMLMRIFEEPSEQCDVEMTQLMSRFFFGQNKVPIVSVGGFISSIFAVRQLDSNEVTGWEEGLKRLEAIIADYERQLKEES